VDIKFMTTNESMVQNQLIDTVIGGSISLWFGDDIKNRKSLETGFDLKPHAAVCLALMTSRSLSSSNSMSYHLVQGGLTSLGRIESYIFVEFGMESLLELGLVGLDPIGESEHKEALATKTYGASGVHWTLTPAGALRAAPLYCSNIGKTSDYQQQAISDMLEANKTSIKKSRATALSPSEVKAYADGVKKAIDDALLLIPEDMMPKKI
jgi:hypothetical protein